jgi:hypothetical protein
MPCLKTVPKAKSRPLILMRAFKTYICVEKNYVFADLRKFDVRQKYLGSQIANPQTAKIYGLQIANLQFYTFKEGPQIYF